jgi:hypothetical protein
MSRNAKTLNLTLNFPSLSRRHKGEEANIILLSTAFSLRSSLFKYFYGLANLTHNGALCRFSSSASSLPASDIHAQKFSVSEPPSARPPPLIFPLLQACSHQCAWGCLDKKKLKGGGGHGCPMTPPRRLLSAFPRRFAFLQGPREASQI